MPQEVVKAAKGVLVPKVETLRTPQVAVSAAANVQQSFDARGAFGEDIARAGQQIGGQIANYALEQKAKDDAAAVKNAISEYRKSINNRTYLDEDSYYNRQGKDAYDSYEPMASELDDIRKLIGEKLAPGRQQESFSEMSQGFLDRELDSMSRHASKGRMQWQNESDSEAVNQAVEDGSLRYTNNSTEVEQVKALTKNLAARNGWSPERTENETLSKLSTMHKQAIDNMMTSEPLAAEKYFDDHKDQILPSMHDDIKRQIKNADDGMLAQSTADAALAFDSLTSARDFVKESITDNPKARQKALSMVEHEFRVLDHAKRTEQAEIVDTVGKHRLDGGSVQRWAINNPSEWDKLDFKQQESLLKTGKVETDWEVYSELEDKIEAGDIEREADIRSFGSQISPVHLNTLAREFKKRKQISNSQLRRLYSDYGGKVGTPSKPLKGEKADQWNAFKDYITNNLEETARPEDLDKWASRWFTSGEARGSKWYHVFGDTDDTLGEAITAGRADNFVIDLPEDVDPEEMRSMFATLGVEGDVNDSYWKLYVPAADWLEAHKMQVNNAHVGAVIFLRNQGLKVNADNIDYVIQSSRTD